VILILAILSICCGHQGYQAMAEWVENYQHILQHQVTWLAGYLPDGSTFYRVLSGIEAKSLEAVFSQWIAKIVPATSGEGIAVDGKSIHGTGLHLVSAFAHRAGSVLYEQGTDTKGKELVVGPQVINQIDIAGKVVTADALFAQRSICQQIVTQAGGYVIAVKGNQGHLEETIHRLFTYPDWDSQPKIYQTVEKHKGRIEERTMEVLENVHGDLEWPGVTHVWRVRSQVTAKGKQTTQVRVGIARLFDGTRVAEQIAKLVRGHWGIENRLHRQRDVVFGEDRCTIRARHGPQVMAALRNLVTTLFHQASARSFPSVMRRFAAKPEELVEFLGLTQKQLAV
jgi:predicted transposase YbfD/YdcC